MSMPATDTPVTDQEADIRLRVSLGAAGFDRIEPGWFTPDRIDLLTLDVENPFTCPIAQVFRDRGGHTVIEMIDPEAVAAGDSSAFTRYGFCCFDFYNSVREEVSLLNDAWIREILTRRNSREAAVTINS